MVEITSVGYIDVSIGIPAYNEEKNIGRLLNALICQKTDTARIIEILVISSSNDKTNDIVTEFSKIDSRIKLIKEVRRKGKASAVNTFLNNAKCEVLILESADTLPRTDVVEKLTAPFLDKKVGMTAGHPIPINSRNTFMGYISHMLWHFHHVVALMQPKCGEMIAFRKIFSKIPDDVCVDEAWIEHEISKRGYKIMYVPDAIVYNKGPETISDFFKQRRRISYGHIDLKHRTNYKVSSLNISLLLKATFKAFKFKGVKEFIWFISAILLEIFGRFCGYVDYYLFKKQHNIWSIAISTKNLGKLELIESELPRQKKP
jgi:cellulose synthase/poly-beta-1,6-N-acetylglucosamine synthase-like glycosyltransferase